jgi:HEAT repeat protein
MQSFKLIAGIAFLAGQVLYGQTSLDTLLAQLQDPSPGVREAAFYQLPPMTASSSDQLKLALIGLLSTETAYENSDAYPVVDDDPGEDYGEYYASLIGAVVSLNDPRAIPPLVDVINTGGMATNAIAGFGTAALTPVLGKLADSDPTVRNGAVLVLKTMLQANAIPDEASQLAVQTALQKASADSDYFVSLSAKEALSLLVTVSLASTQLTYPGATNVVVAVAGTPTATGTVNIYDGTTLLTTANLQGNGDAYWYISPGLTAGTHQISATYAGDANHPAGQSTPVTVTVNPVGVNFGVACWSADPKSYQCTINVSSNAGAALGTVTYSLDSGTAVTLPLTYGNAQFKVVPGAGSHPRDPVSTTGQFRSISACHGKFRHSMIAGMGSLS